MTSHPGRRSLAVFEAPPLPGGWQRGDAIRIVDPPGRYAGWAAPARAGGLIALFARPTPRDDWVPIVAPPDDASSLGGELLARNGDSWIPAGERATGWSFTRRDPTSVTATGRLESIPLALTCRCEDGIQVEVDWGLPGQAGFRFRLRPGMVATGMETTGPVLIRCPAGPIVALDVQPGPGWACRPGARHIDIVPVGGDTSRASGMVSLTARFAGSSPGEGA